MPTPPGVRIEPTEHLVSQCSNNACGYSQSVAIPRGVRPQRRPPPTQAAPSPSAELTWLRDQVEQAHLILDTYGVPRTRVGNGHKVASVTLTLAGRLRLAFADSPRKARHAAPEEFDEGMSHDGVSGHSRS